MAVSALCRLVGRRFAGAHGLAILAVAFIAVMFALPTATAVGGFALRANGALATGPSVTIDQTMTLAPPRPGGVLPDLIQTSHEPVTLTLATPVSTVTPIDSPVGVGVVTAMLPKDADYCTAVDAQIGGPAGAESGATCRGPPTA